VQELGIPTHCHPDSIVQEAEQPSPLTLFPSSHCSVAALIRRSPQTGAWEEEEDREEEELEGGETEETVDDEEETGETEEITDDEEGAEEELTMEETELEEETEESTSVWQVAEQPSPLTVFPSSHASAPSFFPFPQT